MDKHQQIIDWLRLMGFDSEIPESLSSICNHSTAFIWDQLMQNGKPKHEVDSLRNNIIIRRLKTQPLNKQDEFSYPIKEIDLYIKRQSLENMLIEKLKGKIKENEERKYILDKKCKMLEKSIQEAEETLTCSKNLTPVELEENPNTREITVRNPS
ncbi:hypothetical protein NQ317_001441 [Molorchus minor]|uniref:HAUS augmin-like complex subunit 1 n=1 Tax=Molorchus minor TaxID=1323400 RepID=A0ABQ9JN02_9CUCU|nr:hypothetical protein NQ317_001441 [Molorchus minor]